jgi:hypothetical protein
MHEVKQKAPYRELRHVMLLQFPVKPAQIASDKGLHLHLTESVSIVLSLYPVGSALKTFKGPHINHSLYRSGLKRITVYFKRAYINPKGRRTQVQRDVPWK